MNEREFNERLGMRYEIDYRIVPKMFMKSPAAMLGTLLNEDACSLLSAIYNDVYDGARVFTSADFRAERYMDEDDFVYLVNLPKENESKIDKCSAYGFAFIRNGDAMAAQFFIIEAQNDGDKVICGIDVNLEHLELCDAAQCDADSAALMLRIAKSNKQFKNPVKIEF